MAMVNSQLLNGKGQNGIDAIYMLHQLSETTGEPFRNLGEARKDGRQWQFFPKPGLGLKPCRAPRLKTSPAGKGLEQMVEDQLP
jgi:hypothetical protein